MSSRVKLTKLTATELNQYKKEMLLPLQFPHKTFFKVSPWESLGDHSKSCTVNIGYADALWIKPRTLVTLLTNAAKTLKSKSGISN